MRQLYLLVKNEDVCDNEPRDLLPAYPALYTGPRSPDIAGK
jgi:hypothetical protein